MDIMLIIIIVIAIMIVGVFCAVFSSNSSDRSENIPKKEYSKGDMSNIIDCECGFTYNQKLHNACPNCGLKVGMRPNPEKITDCTCGCSYDLRIHNECPECGKIPEILKNTKHIIKNGLSFNYPEYYDIGSYPSSDEIHKSMVALSKNDRTCELYVMEYRSIHFDDYARRKKYLLKEYLKQQGYTNISENKNLPYCFNAIINSEVGRIKTTIAYNFNYYDVIMIVGNVPAGVDYYCIEDMKIIYNTIMPMD